MHGGLLFWTIIQRHFALQPTLVKHTEFDGSQENFVHHGDTEYTEMHGEPRCLRETPCPPCLRGEAFRSSPGTDGFCSEEMSGALYADRHCYFLRRPQVMG